MFWMTHTVRCALLRRLDYWNRFDALVGEAEKTMIRGAMLTISMNTNQCINFDGYDPGRPAMDYLYISKHFNDG